ncbi:MAG TPA: carboxypeptidase-like regulatory domain-containing protein [Terriglobales bacterium]|nr:carboxypeptidase-like regulatory domain-containing protein [Terriglobales bacterium]
MSRKVSTLFLLSLLLLIPSLVYSQTAANGAVVGTVRDASGAVVRGATVTLVQPGTSLTQTAKTDSGGRFAFPAVLPGTYNITFSASGFRKTTVNGLDVQINKSAIVDQTLEVGAASEVVEVVAPTMTELQTTDSSVGEVLSGQELNRLPVQGRSAAQLIFYQPAVVPDVGMGDTMGGQIAGSRSEQITFTIDGGDATSDLEGSNSYTSPDQEATAVSPVVPIPQDAVSEFRVATNNANSTFGESSGGQVTFVTKSGTNTIHGSVYEYHDDDGLNANGWTNDHNSVVKPPSVDNRFGAGVGGPIIKDKLFYYGFYEGRRFHDQTEEDRMVPTASLKSGIITFNGVQYNFNPANGPLAALCGPSGTAPCDPRGLGVSPVVMSELALFPAGNNPGEGDGLNTIGLTIPVATPVSTNVGKLKLNYVINNKWTSFVTWQYSSTSRTGTEQIDLLTTPASSVSADPYYANFYTFQVQGQLSPTFLSVTHGSYLKNWWGWARQAPTPLVSGTNNALIIGGENTHEDSTNYGGTGAILAQPININTQDARPRVWDGHDWYIAQDFTKIVGAHQFQFGGDGRIWHDFHKRTDQVLGGLTTGPITYVGSSNLAQDSFATISSAYQPPALSAAQLPFWNGYYASLLGIVDHGAQVETRNGAFQPNPLGTPTLAYYTLPSFNAYLQDVWKVRKDLTVTAGLNWGVVLPPSVQGGLAATMVYADSNTPVNIQQFLKSRDAALSAGDNYNPLLGVSPVNSLSAPFDGKMRQGIWKDLGPRIAVAWQVPWENKVFGNHQTVIRGGYALVWDRTSAVTAVLSGLLAGGLADIDTCGGPTFNGSGTAVCSNGLTDPTTAFRIGHDGANVPIPTPTADPIPLIPQLSSLSRSFGADAYLTSGYAHTVDFTIQRALPHNFFFEMGYIGRFSRNLSQDTQIDSADLRQKDPKSGQTYGQAFDAVDKAFLAGTSSTLSPQPFFENMGNAAACAFAAPLVGATGTTCTSVASALMPIVGPADFGFLDYEMNAIAVPGSTPNAGLFTTPTTNNQIFGDAQISDGGYSDYNAMIVTLRKALSRGLQFQFNYTWSHAIGIQGTNQQYIYSANDPYNLSLDRAGEVFDHRQVVNALWYYELPIGKGKLLNTGSSTVVDRIVGGWSFSGIFTYYTGYPDCPVVSSSNYGAFFGTGCAIPTGAIPSMGKNYGVTGSVAGAPLSGSINAFANPAAVYNSLAFPSISTDKQIPHDDLYTFPYWNFDFSLGKKIPITERVAMNLSCDAFNVFNHVTFAAPNSMDLDNPSAFGVITSQYAPGVSPTGARILQLGLRLDF